MHQLYEILLWSDFLQAFASAAVITKIQARFDSQVIVLYRFSNGSVVQLC